MKQRNLTADWWIEKTKQKGNGEKNSFMRKLFAVCYLRHC